MSQTDLDAWLAQIQQCRPLSEPQMKTLCSIVKSQLLEESNVQPIASPVTVVGDIHGQFWDVLELFRIAGECPATSYIFMVRWSSAPFLGSQETSSIARLIEKVLYYRETLWIEAISRWKHSRSSWS